MENKSQTLVPNKRRQTVSKSTDLTNKIKKLKSQSLEEVKSTTEIKKEYIDINLIEILQLIETKGNMPQSNLKIFCVFNIRQQQNDNVKIRNLKVYSDALKKPKVIRVEGSKAIELRRKFTVTQRVIDTFFKRILNFLLETKTISFDMNDHAKYLKYSGDMTFDPLINIFNDYSKTTLEPMSFIPVVYYTLNNDFKSFLLTFFNYNIKDYMSLRKKIQSGFLTKFNIYSGVYLHHINLSEHLFLQRSLLPFSITSHRELRFGICTWNLAGKDMGKHFNYFEQISKKLTKNNLDIIVLGFQEIVELKISWGNLKKIMFKCEEISIQIKELWDRLIGGSYSCVSALNLMGIFQLVYVHHRRYGDILKNKFVNWEDKYGGKVGIKMGNKGAVGSIFHMKYFGILSFSNCHLTHGFDKVNKRLEKLLSIIEKVKSKKDEFNMSENSISDKIKTPHFDFILGDFNMLIEIEKEDIQRIVFDEQNFKKEKDFLFKNEQLIRCMRETKELKEYKEHNIGDLKT
jgi:hypothetical protein